MDLSVSLPLDLMGLVEAKIASGQFATPSEVVREALLLLKQADEEAAACLRQAWTDGIASGDAGPIDFVELRLQALERLAGQAKE